MADADDALLKTPLTLKAVSAMLGVLGVVWVGATQVNDLQSQVKYLKAELDNSRAYHVDQLRHLTERSVQMDQQQEAKIAALQTSLATHATTMAEVRATLQAVQQTTSRIEKLLDNRSASGGR